MKIKSATLLLAMLTICSGLTMAQTHPKKAPAKKGAAKMTAADIAAGQGLLAKSDCLACHKLDTKLVGPAYKEVAAKYPATEANYNMLTQKVINGGSGNWGQVAMSPHPSLASADVKKMVAYILTVK